MTVKTTFQKIGNYLTFKDNTNRIGFLFLLILAQLVNLLAVEFISQLNHIFHLPNSVISIYEVGRGILFCYMFGIAIVARLRTLKLNPSLAYFFVIFLWILHYVTINLHSVPLFVRSEFEAVMVFLLLIPLFAKDKKPLLFWRTEE